MDRLRAYAFVSVFVAHAADGKLGSDEVAAIQRNVRRVAGTLGHSLAAADAIVEETIWSYWDRLDVEGPARTLERFEAAAGELQRLLPPAALATVQADLTAVADADGERTDMERLLIGRVAARWRSMHH